MKRAPTPPMERWVFEKRWPRFASQRVMETLLSKSVVCYASKYALNGPQRQKPVILMRPEAYLNALHAAIVLGEIYDVKRICELIFTWKTEDDPPEFDEEAFDQRWPRFHDHRMDLIRVGAVKAIGPRSGSGARDIRVMVPIEDMDAMHAAIVLSNQRYEKSSRMIRTWFKKAGPDVSGE